MPEPCLLHARFLSLDDCILLLPRRPGRPGRLKGGRPPARASGDCPCSRGSARPAAADGCTIRARSPSLSRRDAAALALDDVDHLVVDVAVVGCPPRRDHAEELRHVAGADVVVDEVPELAVASGRKRRPVPVADRSLLGARRGLVLRCADRDHDELLRPRVVELEAFAGRDVGARVRLEVVGTAVEDERALPRDDEENLLSSSRWSGGLDRPRAQRISRCSSRSEPEVPSIVTFTAAVSPARRWLSTACSETTKPRIRSTSPLPHPPAILAPRAKKGNPWSASAADGEDEVPVLVQPRCLAGRDHEGRDRRPRSRDWTRLPGRSRSKS